MNTKKRGKGIKKSAITGRHRQAADGAIIIIQIKEQEINTDLSTWDQQFKAAIKKSEKPEKDLFEGIENDFDSKEW